MKKSFQFFLIALLFTTLIALICSFTFLLAGWDQGILYPTVEPDIQPTLSVSSPVPTLPTPIQLPEDEPITFSITFHDLADLGCQTPIDQKNFIGTEEFSWRTCLTIPDGVTEIYLVATKPTTVVVDGVSPNYEVTSFPMDIAQPGISYHARYSIPQNQFFGFIPLKPDDPFSVENWTVGGFSPDVGNYLYLNRDGIASTNFSPGESVFRWRIGNAQFHDHLLQLDWSAQLLDVTFLHDELLPHEGIEKPLEFFVRTEDTDWIGPLFSISRQGDFLFTGIERAKDHTLIESDKFHLISMQIDPAKSYLQYSFDLSLTPDGKLQLSNLENRPFLNPDFDITESRKFCRLSAPHLLPAAGQLLFYFTLFGYEGTQGCLRPGTQSIYIAQSNGVPEELSLSRAVPVLVNARDPFVNHEWLYYAEATQPALSVRNLLSGEDALIFNAEWVWPENPNAYWPESPNLVISQQQQYLFFSSKSTKYLTHKDGVWTYQGPLSLPRSYVWYEQVAGEYQKMFYGIHWAAEFLEVQWGGESAILSSFQSVQCQDIAARICYHYPISLGFLNFDVYGHPYLAVSPLVPPALAP